MSVIIIYENIVLRIVSYIYEFVRKYSYGAHFYLSDLGIDHWSWGDVSFAAPAQATVPWLVTEQLLLLAPCSNEDLETCHQLVSCVILLYINDFPVKIAIYIIQTM